MVVVALLLLTGLLTGSAGPAALRNNAGSLAARPRRARVATAGLRIHIGGTTLGWLIVAAVKLIQGVCQVVSVAEWQANDSCGLWVFPRYVACVAWNISPMAAPEFRRDSIPGADALRQYVVCGPSLALSIFMATFFSVIVSNSSAAFLFAASKVLPIMFSAILPGM